MKLLLLVLICVGSFEAHDEPSPKVQSNRIANEYVQKKMAGLNAKMVKGVSITFMYMRDMENIKYRTVHVTKRQEIVALIHAFRVSTREKGVAMEPVGIQERGDDFEFYLRDQRDIGFSVYPSEVATFWGPEVASLHRHYRKLAAHIKPTDSWPD